MSAGEHAQKAYDLLRMNPGVDMAVQDIAQAIGVPWQTVSRALGRAKLSSKNWPGLKESKKVKGTYRYDGPPMEGGSSLLPAVLGLPNSDADLLEEPEPWEVGSHMEVVSAGDKSDIFFVKDANDKIWSVERCDVEDQLYG